MARTKQTARLSGSGPMRAMVPPPKKGSIEWQLAEAQRTAAAKEAKLTQELHALRKTIDEDRKIQQAKFELAVTARIKLIEEMQAREQARAAEVVTPMTDAASSESQSDSSAAASSSSSAAAASVAASTADYPITHIHDLALPPHWPAAQSHHVTLETLSADHADFKMVERMMHTTGMANAGVLQVQRIHNRPLWDRYVQARARIMSKVGNEHLNNAESMGNEKLMFHGSRHNAPSLIYSNAEGFDVRMAGHGMLGAGLYFSDTAGYSGVSYAHPLAPQTWGPTAGKKYSAAIPPLLTANADGTLKASKIPKNAYQMFLARVCLGTGFDPNKQGGRPHQGYTNRAPLRPFHCNGCKKEVDLEAINVALLRASVMRTPEKTAVAGGATLEEFEEEDAPTVVAASSGKRKRGSTAKSNKKTKTAAVAAPAATVGVAPVPVAAPALPVVASAPLALGPQAAPIVLRKSARHAVAGAPAAVFTPPRKKIRARRNAPAAVVVAPPTPLQLAPVQQIQQPQQQQQQQQLQQQQQQQQLQQQQQQQVQQPQLLVPIVQQLLAVPAAMPPAPVATAAAPAASLADSADDGTITMTDAPELEVPAAIEEPSPVATAASASPAPAASAFPAPAPTPLSFDSTPVCCTNPKCGMVLGTRGSLLAHPYRFDSVISGHMSVTYESAASYPELLITYTVSR